MSGYLDGDDAFDRVLDRMIDAERRAALAEELIRATDPSGTIRTLERDLNNALSDVAAHVAEHKDSLPKLWELWTAADDVAVRLRGGAAIEDAIMKRFTAALEAAREHCDQVPF